MKKLFFLILLLLCGSASVVSAQDLRTIFRDAPDDIFPYLTNNCRADLVDFIDADMTARVANSLDGISELIELDNDFLLLAISPSSTMQVKLLPFKEDTIMCVVRTVKAEADDSRIDFYDMHWNRLECGDKFIYPAIREFFMTEATADEYVGVCDIYLVSLTMNAGDNSIVAEYTMPRYMNIEDAKEVKPLLRKLVYKWNGERFVIE